MTTNPTLLTATSQLAAMRAQQSGPGFSKDPGDYRPLWIKLSGAEFNDIDPKYRPELDRDGFLIGDNAISPKGARVIVLGSVSGFQEKDRVTIKGRETARLYALWKTKPDVTPIEGRGGGLKTDRGGWLAGKCDELFLLTAYGAGVLTLYDQHDIVAELNRNAQSLGVRAMYEAAWTMTKATAPDSGGYMHAEPHFELLGIAGEADGPTKAEIAQGEKLSAMIARIAYPIPGVPLHLVANGPIGEPPADRAPPVKDEGDYDGGKPDPDDDIPDWMR